MRDSEIFSDGQVWLASYEALHYKLTSCQIFEGCHKNKTCWGSMYGSSRSLSRIVVFDRTVCRIKPPKEQCSFVRLSNHSRSQEIPNVFAHYLPRHYQPQLVPSRALITSVTWYTRSKLTCIKISNSFWHGLVIFSHLSDARYV